MSTQSTVATELVESLGSRKGKYAERTAVRAVVVHTTGSGPINRWKKERNTPGKAQPTAFLTAVHRTYRSIMVAGPHYIVGQHGECYQLCDEGLSAWHVGQEGSEAYAREDWLSGLYEWWTERWPEHTSPRDLADQKLWHGGSCNANTLGIEVVPPVDDVGAAWSDACWETLHALIKDLTLRHHIPMSRDFVVTHSDAHPVSRTTPKGLPWDPGPVQWDGWPMKWSDLVA